MRLLLPILLAILGTGAGVGAALLLSSDEAEPVGETQDGTAECAPAEMPRPVSASGPPDGREYVKLANQFVIPVVGPDRVEALVVAALSIEVAQGTTESVYAREPKLRDVFLQVLFDHANIGGFEGNFTEGNRMQTLRKALLQAARPVLGTSVSDVLITEIARQDGA